ncbi:DUF4350 domain-containing protein [Natrarchaeobius halalkaliphilus]|uniref:DUF4350 domain-containing protein n=1 Tax=Natrarchaeobius halalkaliphilus TaxID=1679091 RepID=UPI0014044427|nr:DUF4350 domain-containing protein [Natrarchaeobius halalkaliphilus]
MKSGPHGQSPGTDGDESDSWPAADLALEIDWSRVLVYALGAAVVATLAVGATASTTAFGPFNSEWDGGSEFRERVADDPETDGEILLKTTEYEALSDSETVAVVVAPEEAYADAEADRVRGFVERGGTLVVFDGVDHHGSDLLVNVGAHARFTGQHLRDEYRYDRGPMMPIATPATNHTLTDGVDRLTLNHATAVDPDPSSDSDRASRNVTVLFETSEFARLEESRMDRASETRAVAERNDESGPGPVSSVGSYPVATVEPVGDGRVVVVGDPSITINAMIDRPDNDDFLSNLHTGTDRVALDVSHGESLPPLSSALVTLRQSPSLQAFVGILAVVAVGLSSDRRVRLAFERLRLRLRGLIERIVWNGVSGSRGAHGQGVASNERTARDHQPSNTDE